MRFVDHQPQQLRVAAGPRAAPGEAAGEGVAQLDGKLHPALDAGGIEVCAVQNQPSDPLGMLQGEAQRDVPAVRKTQYVRAGKMQAVHEAEEILGKLGDGEGRFAPGRAAVATGIDGDDAIGSGKEIDLASEVFEVFAVAVQQEQRRARAPLQIVELNVHCDLPARPPGASAHVGGFVPSPCGCGCIIAQKREFIQRMNGKRRERRR